MDSKQFCQLLFAKGIESGMSIEEIDSKMNAGYGRSFVKDLECGTGRFSMDSIMKYIDIIGLNLVIIDSNSINAASNYDQLMELCSKKCRPFPFRKGRLDAYGVRYWVPSSKFAEGVNDWLCLSGFLRYMGKFGYEVDVMSDEQIAQYKAKYQKAKKKEETRNTLAIFLSILIGFLSIYPCVKWAEAMTILADWIDQNKLPGYFGSLACTFLALCMYTVAIPFGCISIVIFLCSLPFTRSINKSLILSFVGIYRVYKYFIGDKIK